MDVLFLGGVAANSEQFIVAGLHFTATPVLSRDLIR
jgi:hypothetical protein